MKKRILSILLAVVMVVGMIPFAGITVFAENIKVEKPVAVENLVYNGEIQQGFVVTEDFGTAYNIAYNSVVSRTKMMKTQSVYSGKHYIWFNLSPGYEWADGTTSTSYLLEWEIESPHETIEFNQAQGAQSDSFTLSTDCVGENGWNCSPAAHFKISSKEDSGKRIARVEMQTDSDPIVVEVNGDTFEPTEDYGEVKNVSVYYKYYHHEFNVTTGEEMQAVIPDDNESWRTVSITMQNDLGMGNCVIGGNVTLDLNGYTLYGIQEGNNNLSAHIFDVFSRDNGDYHPVLTLNDSSANKTGTVTGKSVNGFTPYDNFISLSGKLAADKNNAEFIMNGGTISGFNAIGFISGTVNVEGNAKFIMNGGKIINNNNRTGNYSGGLCMKHEKSSDNPTFEVGGDAVIADNTYSSGIESDIYFQSSGGTAKIRVSETNPLKLGAHFGMSVYDSSLADGKDVSSYFDNVPEKYARYFTIKHYNAENANTYYIAPNGSGGFKTSAENPFNDAEVPVAVEGLVANGQELTGVITGYGELGTKYTLTNGAISATEPGSYSATFTLNGGYTWIDGSTDAKTITWTIAGAPPHTHSFTYSASGAVLTATCADTDNQCDLVDKKVTLTLTKNATANYYVYDGNAKTVDFATNEATAWKAAVGSEAPTITYTAEEGSELTDDKAVKAGSYTATVMGDTNKTVTLDFTIDKATPTVTTAPTAGEITYGQTLAESTLAGGYVQVSSADSTEIGGQFEWTNGTIKPAVSDSNNAEYDVTFTPASEYAENYTTVTCKVKVEVKPTDYANVTTSASGNLPVASGSTVEITLPEIPTGASYGTAVKTVSGDKYDLGTIANGKITATSTGIAKETGDMTFTVPVTPDGNHNGYDITVTVKPVFKTVVTISGLTKADATYNGQGKTGISGTAVCTANSTDVTSDCGTLVYTYYKDSVADANKLEGVPVDAGDYVLVVSVPESSADYEGSTDISFTIKPRVTLKQGKNIIATGTADITDKGEVKDFDFGEDSIPDGAYNMVIETGDKTVTTYFEKKDDTDPAEVNMTEIGYSSTVKINGADTPDVLVGGLDEVAKNKKTNINLTVESKSVEDADVQDETTALGNLNSNDNISYIEIMINDGKVTVTDNLLEIIVPFDIKNCKNIKVYRYHKGDNPPEEELTRITDLSMKEDGTFYIDEKAGTIHIFATKFSVYAIGYDEVSQSSGSHSGGSSEHSVNYKVNAYNADNGQVSTDRKTADTGNTVTITAVPNEGYKLSRLAVTDKDGKAVIYSKSGSGQYSFTMPASDVNINATFVTSQSNSGCPKDETCPINPFTDTDNEGWYHDGIHYCLEHKYMKGMDTTLFEPDGITTRAQIVTILYRMEGEPDFTNNSSFTDLKADSWYENAVFWANVKEVVTGYDDTHFEPDDKITREQLATILYRYAKYKGIDASSLADISGYADAGQISDWALTAMEWANKAILVNGRTETELAPQGTATRAEAATMIQRFCENILK